VTLSDNNGFIVSLLENSSNGLASIVYLFREPNNVRIVFGGRDDEDTAEFAYVGVVSPDLKFVSLRVFSCIECDPEYPNLYLLNLETRQYQNVHKLSYFTWGFNGDYSFKEYDLNKLDCKYDTKNDSININCISKKYNCTFAPNKPSTCFDTFPIKSGKVTN
jgi:hypothetical protein